MMLTANVVKDAEAAGFGALRPERSYRKTPQTPDIYRHVGATGGVPRPARPWFPEGGLKQLVGKGESARSAQENRLTSQL